MMPRTLLLIALVCCATVARPAAQSIDYRAFEQMFGEPVTSSATGKPQRASEAPVNMEIITQDDIRRSGATNIADVLRFVPGVDVRSYGMADAQVGIRGYNKPYNPRLLVLVNGRQVYSDDYGHVSWMTIPVQLDEIRQIEVIKGPNSALYGFNAVSGVVNIITYDPLRDNINTATIRGGTQNYLGGSAVATGRIGEKAGVRISLGGFRSSDFAPASLQVADLAARQSPLIGSFNIDGRARITPDVEAGLEVSMANGRIAEKNFAAGFDTSLLRTNSLRSWISADTSLGLLSLSAYRNAQLLSIEGAQLGSPQNWLRGAVSVVQASNLVKLGADHTIRVGAEYRDNAITSPGFARGTIGYEVYAGSLMWDWRITPKISATNAVRVDHLQLRYSGTPFAGSGLTAADYNRTKFSVVSFNSGLVYQPTDKDTVRLLAARGVQVPSLADFGLQLTGGALGPLVVSGNPHMRPTIVYNLEANYDRALPSLASILRAAVFAQRNEDLLSAPLGNPLGLGPTGLPLILAGNIGRSDAIGTEVGVRGRSASGYRWNLSYSFVTTTDHTNVTSQTNPVDYARSVPRHVVAAGIGYSRGRLEMDLMGRWQSAYRDFRMASGGVVLQPVEVSNYLALNARIGYRLTDTMTMAIAVQQFNTSRLMQTAGPAVERRVIISLRVQL